MGPKSDSIPTGNRLGETQTEEEKPHEDRGRGQREAKNVWGTPRSWTRQEEAPLEPSEGGDPASTSTLDFWPPDWENILLLF